MTGRVSSPEGMWVCVCGYQNVGPICTHCAVTYESTVAYGQHTSGRTPSSVRSDGPRFINLSCLVCDEHETYPNKGLGRAMAAAWVSRHQHKEDR